MAGLFLMFIVAVILVEMLGGYAKVFYLKQ